MTHEMMPMAKNNQESLDWGRLDQIKAEMGSITDSIKGNFDQIKAMAEIAKERDFQGSPKIQEKSNQILKKFEPGGEYVGVLYKMIQDLSSIKSEAFSEGLEITQDDLNKKLEEING